MAQITLQGSEGVTVVVSRFPVRTVVFVLALAVVLLTAGCAGGAMAPPITQAADATASPGKFVWYDLLTEDLPGVKRFYGELLGWTFSDTELPQYTLIEHDGRPIGGIVDLSGRKTSLNESQWVSLLSVIDVDVAARKTEQAGGEIHVAPKEIPGRGRLAVVTDPQGALIAYIRASGGDPPDRKARPGDWLWTELWTGDLGEAEGFYRNLVDYELDDKTILGEEYVIFTRGGVPRSGVITNPDEKLPSHWLPYIRVEDAAALADRVEGLGGKVALAPSPEIRQGTVAIVVDPSGAPVALQQWGES